jgi:hypothetical protein
MSGHDADSTAYARKVRAALRVRCVHLRTKAAFLGMPGPGDPENVFDTAVWWCGVTCEALGPDGASASPERCSTEGRACRRMRAGDAAS